MRNPLVDPQPGDIISFKLINCDRPPLTQVVIRRTSDTVHTIYLGKTKFYETSIAFWQNWEGFEVNVLYVHNQELS